MSLLFVLLPFDAVGAAMAFLISYDELERHYGRSRRAVIEAGRRAAVAFVFLAVLSLIVVLILKKANG
jgi:hypothetical protein